MVFNELILKVTSCCNLNCDYCYVFNQGDYSYKYEPNVMPFSLITTVISRIKKHCEAHKVDMFLIIFHGGEPLMASKQFYRDFIAQAKERITSTEILYGIQTNATLLTQEWIDLFDELDIAIGISLDGTRESSKHRVYRSTGQYAYDNIIKGVELLKSNALPVNVLCVINTSVSPLAIYSNFKEIGVDNVDFLYPDVTVDTGSDSHTGAWLSKMFDLWYEDNDTQKPMIRYFDTVVSLLLGIERGYEMLGRKPNKTISLKPNGNIELVDNLKICGDGFTHTGKNITDSTFDDIAQNSVMQKYYYSHSDKILCEKCKKCCIKDICGGGNIAHRYSKVNGFDNPSAYCKHILHFVAHVQDRLFEDLPKVFNTNNVVRIKEMIHE